jgi:hypothetical protein
MTEPPRSPYEVLGITPDATPAQIRAAYRRRALELHPDRFPSEDEAHVQAGALMRELNDAWRQLQPSMKPGAIAGTATERPLDRPPGWQPFPPAGRWGHGCAWLAAAGAALLIASVIALIVVLSSGRSATGTAPTPSTVAPAVVSTVCRDLRSHSVDDLAQVYWSEDPSHTVTQYEEAIEVTARQGCPSEL